MTTLEFVASDTTPPPPAESKMTHRDFAWHRMDTDKNLMVINSILLFEGPLDVGRLVSTIAHRLPNYPRFTQKVVTRWGQPRWIEDTQFDILSHIQLETLGAHVNDSELRLTVAKTPVLPRRLNEVDDHVAALEVSFTRNA